MTTPTEPNDQAPEPQQAGTPERPRRRRPPAPAPRPESVFVVAIRRLVTPTGALAHLPGDMVPAQNVARNGWADGVRPLDGE